MLTALRGETVIPLALRLYLPRNWASDPTRLAEAGVPEEHRVARSRGGVALSLLDEVAAEGVSFSNVVATARFAGDSDFQDGLARRGVTGLAESHPFADERRRRNRDALELLKTRFGLEHFEGRSWRGFHHHAALVALAYWHSIHDVVDNEIPRDVVF